jgi:hypothetical protein
MAVLAGRVATEAPVDAEAEAARAVPAGPVAAVVNPVSQANPANPVNLADSQQGGTASMTAEHFRNVEIPRVGREVGSQRGPAGDACQAAGEASRSVMVLLAKLIGILFMAGFGLTLLVVVGCSRAGWAGIFAPLAVTGMVLMIVYRCD